MVQPSAILVFCLFFKKVRDNDEAKTSGEALDLLVLHSGPVSAAGAERNDKKWLEVTSGNLC